MQRFATYLLVTVASWPVIAGMSSACNLVAGPDALGKFTLVEDSGVDATGLDSGRRDGTVADSAAGGDSGTGVIESGSDGSPDVVDSGTPETGLDGQTGDVEAGVDAPQRDSESEVDGPARDSAAGDSADGALRDSALPEPDTGSVPPGSGCGENGEPCCDSGDQCLPGLHCTGGGCCTAC
jgi:hypothetical protein